MLVYLLRRRLREFSVDRGERVEVVVDENVLSAHVQVVEVKRLLGAAFEDLRVVDNIAKHERPLRDLSDKIQSAIIIITQLFFECSHGYERPP